MNSYLKLITSPILNGWLPPADYITNLNCTDLSRWKHHQPELHGSLRSERARRLYTLLSRRDSTSETRPCTALPEPCCIDLRWSSDPLRVSSSAYVDVTNTAWRRHYESCTGCLWRGELSLNCWPWCTASCMQTLHVTLLTLCSLSQSSFGWPISHCCS